MNRDLNGRPPLSRTDKLCLLALVGILVAITIFYELTEGRSIRASEVDKLSESQEDFKRAPLQVDSMVFYGDPPTAEFLPPAMGQVYATLLSDEIESDENPVQTYSYDETIPLSGELQAVLRESCEEHGVAMCDALGVIWVESRFDPDADNGLCYGYMGLNRNYYPPDLTPAENIRAGVAHLAGQIEWYGGDIQAALRAYNKGWDDGDRQYSKAVLEASKKWGGG